MCAETKKDEEEDIYFTQSVVGGSMLYCYDAEVGEVLEIGLVEGGVSRGIVDEEN